MYAEWTAEQLEKKLKEGASLRLIDVRETDEWVEGHIAEAKLLPLSEFVARWEEVKEGDGPLVLVCRSGNRSGKACAFLAEMGVDAINLEGGMLGWTGGVVTGA